MTFMGTYTNTNLQTAFSDISTLNTFMGSHTNTELNNLITLMGTHAT